MRRPQLDLSALHNTQSAQTLKESGANQFGTSLGNIIFSRRELLKMTGVAAIGWSPTLSALGAALQGPFEFTFNDRRAAFKIGGREQWVIDIRRFGGNPLLKTTRDERLIHLELVNAKYPGTELSADMSCEIRRRQDGWRMKLRLALGDFISEVPFEGWLAGKEAAVSGVSLNTAVCELGSRRGMLMNGMGQAEFFPNWVLKIAGQGICQLSGFGGEILSDFLLLSLLEPAEPSLTTHPEAKRTLISLRRGDRSWPLEPIPNTADGWKITAADGSFDLLHLEVGESARGSVAGRALLAESNVEEAKLFFHPSAHLTDADGNRFALPLRRARYAVALDAHGEQTALVAGFAKEAVWLHHQGVGLQLGATAETTRFELVCTDGRLESLHCSPAVLGLAASLPDSVVEHGPMVKGSHLSFRLGAAELARSQPAPDKEAAPPLGQLRIGVKEAGEPDISLSLPLQSISVLRADDLLSLGFSFFNLSLDVQSSGPILRRTDPSQGALITVRFPPQHILEQAFAESAFQASRGHKLTLPSFLAAHFQQIAQEPSKFPVRGRLSGKSQLVFVVPDTMQEIEYTLKSLLDWGRFKLLLVPNGYLPPPPPPELGINVIPPTLPEPPAIFFDLVGRRDFFSYIEAPAKLFLTPNEAAAWAHSREAVMHEGRTELWHTRLGVKGADGQLEAAGQADAVDEQNDYYRTLRAFGYLKGDEFNVSPTSDNRRQLVGLTTNFSATDPSWRGRVIHVDRLMLTTLGAWMNVRYAADPPSEEFDLEEWRHRMTMGRDHYVRVVTKGYLFPFGHRASLVTITERKFRAIPGSPEVGDLQKGQVGAFLLQRGFIIVRQPVKVYGNTGLTTGSGGSFGDPQMNSNSKSGESVDRMLPFKSVRLTTLVTPDLKFISDIDVLKADILRKEQDGQPLLFQMIAEDKDGQLVDFTAPLMFVPAATQVNGKDQSDPNSGAYKAAGVKPAATIYASQDMALRRRPFEGQKISFAESKVSSAEGTQQGATTFETDTMIFDAFLSDQPKGFAADQPAFFPVMAESVIHIQSIEKLIGNNEKPAVRFHNAFLTAGFEGAGNQGEVLFKLSNKNMLLDFKGKADKAGGLATPSINIDGLSRKFGPVGDSANLATGNFKPAMFFDTKQAQLLGGITLDKVIKALEPKDFDAEKVPRLTNTILSKDGAPVEARTELFWNPEVKSDDDGNFFRPKNPRGLSITATTITPLAGDTGSQQPPYSVTGRLDNFGLSFFDLVTVNFDHLIFSVQSGKKLDVNATLDESNPVTFGGPLSFINVLAKIIPPALFSDPPSLDIDSSGVSVGYSIGLPAIEGGAWGIRNLVIGAKLIIPFTGADPMRLRFNFSEQHNPFQVAAYGVTGGAFLALHIGLDGIERVEASVELGGSLALNLGVASGAVFLMIGIHMTMEGKKNDVTLGGYVRTGGALSVLGLITVSVEFYMELAYLFASNMMRGEASLTVKVKVLFFSKKVTLTVVRELGAPSPSARLLRPTVNMETAHLADESAWGRYCDAFA
jgi:hypothetical protein